MTIRACFTFLFSFLTSAVLAQPPAAPLREFPQVKMVLDRNLEFTRSHGQGLLLDLYRPRQTSNVVATPVLIWIHGEEGRFAGRYPCPIASMIGNGYAVASIDYRSDKDARVPDQVEDCRAAVHWLRDNAAKYNLDASHFGAWGWSEGGRLAVLLSAGEWQDSNRPLAKVDPANVVQTAIDFAGPGAWRFSPADAQPNYRSCAPLMIVHGEDDEIMQPKDSRTWNAALRDVGVKSTLAMVKGASHEFKQLRQGDVVEIVNNFLDAQLKGGAHVRFKLLKIDPPDDAWVDPIIDEPVGTKYMTFPAASLGPGGEASYLIYLPPGYEKSASKHYPVLYYLHGGGGSQRVGDIWVQKLDAAIRSGQIPPMISVLVEGLPGGRFLDAPDGKSPIESVVIKDLIPHIDATYRTIPKRESRVLEGLSMGGYGVFHLGFKYPEMFGMISGMCNGIPPSGKNYDGSPLPPFSPYDLAATPYTLAEKNLVAIKGRTPIRIIVGTEDFTLAANEEFHAHLLKLGIPHEYKIVPGISHGYKEYYEQLDFSFFKTVATK